MAYTWPPAPQDYLCQLVHQLIWQWSICAHTVCNHVERSTQRRPVCLQRIISPTNEAWARAKDVLATARGETRSFVTAGIYGHYFVEIVMWQWRPMRGIHNVLCYWTNMEMFYGQTSSFVTELIYQDMGNFPCRDKVTIRRETRSFSTVRERRSFVTVLRMCFVAILGSLGWDWKYGAPYWWLWKAANLLLSQLKGKCGPLWEDALSIFE